MARLAKSGVPAVQAANDEELDSVAAFEPAIAAHVATVVAENPRGAPITLPAFCVLDDAPVHSYLVILQWPGEKPEVVLQTPAERMDVPPDDLAWRLPLGAEIRRTGPHSFVGHQRDATDVRPKLVCSTAVEACRTFKKHFHDERD